MTPEVEETDKEQEWKCPITDICSPRKLHRPCTQTEKHTAFQGACIQHHGAGKACWDCCTRCQSECKEPAMDTINYDMPD